MSSRTTPRLMAAGAIGNLLEWYDFAVYGYFAAQIGRAFFPEQDKVAQLLAAFGVFAVGFMMRPVGGAVFGHIGDRFGHRAALTLSVAAMAVPTFLIGVLPGYDVLGLAAPILLTLLRMVQGMSVGGEYTTSIIFLVEGARPERRGVVGAVADLGGVTGILLGSATGAVLEWVMPAQAVADWGWRVPFWIGLLVGLAGLVLRRGLREESGAGAGQPRERSPLLVELEIDGELRFRSEALPAGTRRDGLATLYHRLPIAAGMHRIVVRMRDRPQGEFNHVREETLDLAGGDSVLIDFNASRGGLEFRR